MGHAFLQDTCKSRSLWFSTIDGGKSRPQDIQRFHGAKIYSLCKQLQQIWKKDRVGPVKTAILYVKLQQQSKWNHPEGGSVIYRRVLGQSSSYQ